MCTCMFDLLFHLLCQYQFVSQNIYRIQSRTWFGNYMVIFWEGFFVVAFIGIYGRRSRLIYPWYIRMCKVICLPIVQFMGGMSEESKLILHTHQFVSWKGCKEWIGYNIVKKLRILIFSRERYVLCMDLNQGW